MRLTRKELEKWCSPLTPEELLFGLSGLYKSGIEVIELEDRELEVLDIAVQVVERLIDESR